MQTRKGIAGVVGLLLTLTLTACGGQASNPDAGTTEPSAGEQAATTPAPKPETPTVLRIPKEAAISCEEFAELAPEVFGGLYLVHSTHKEENGTYGNIDCMWSTEPDIKSESEYSIGLNIIGNNTSVDNINKLLDMGVPEPELHSGVFDGYGGTIRGDLDPKNIEKYNGSYAYRIMSFVPILELNLSYSCDGSSAARCRKAPVGLTTDTGIAFLEDVVEAITAAQ